MLGIAIGTVLRVRKLTYFGTLALPVAHKSKTVQHQMANRRAPLRSCRSRLSQWESWASLESTSPRAFRVQAIKQERGALPRG